MLLSELVKGKIKQSKDVMKSIKTEITFDDYKECFNDKIRQNY